MNYQRALNGLKAHNKTFNSLRCDVTSCRTLTGRYMPLKIFISLLFLVFVSSQVNAGGSYFSVNIKSFAFENSKFHFIATLNEEFNYDDSGCKSIEVSGSYDTDMWDNYTILINQSIYESSLELLEAAANENREINLGYIGSGFKKVGRCKYVSKGIFHSETGVFSIHDGI